MGHFSSKSQGYNKPHKNNIFSTESAVHDCCYEFTIVILKMNIRLTYSKMKKEGINLQT